MSRFVLPVASVGEGISPFDGAKLYFYDTGTSTPKDTYSDPDLTIPNSNPVEADADGFFPDIFIGSSYKVILTDKNDVQQYEWDPVEGAIEAPTQQINYYEWSNVVFGQALSGTSVTITGIDPTATKILISIANCNPSTDGLALRVGSGSIATSGYAGVTSSSDVSGATVNWVDWSPDAFGALGSGSYVAVGQRTTGAVTATITLDKTLSTRWDINGFARNDVGTTNVMYWLHGRCDPMTDLDRIQVLTNNGATFADGSVTVKQYAATGTLLSSLQLDAMGEYGNQGDFYLNNGTADDLVLELPVAPDVDVRTTYPPLNGTTYMAGTKARYQADASNTGPMTASLGTGPVLDVVDRTGAPLTADQIPIGSFVTLNYDYVNDYWVADVLEIPDDFITTDMIQDDAITTDKIADGAVTADKLATGAVTNWTLLQEQTIAAPVATVEFTSIPSTAKYISIIFRGVSTDGNVNMLLQLGTGAPVTYVTSGYSGSWFEVDAGGTSSDTWPSNGCLYAKSRNATRAYDGSITLQKYNTNYWNMQSSNGCSVAANRVGNIVNGYVDAAATVTAVKFLLSGGNYDAGTIALYYS